MSIRKFTSDPVPREQVAAILELACRAPSAMNTQPWEFVVLTGDVLERIKKENVRLVREQAQSNPDHSAVGWPKDSIFRKRQVDLAKELFRLMDIAREDTDKRQAWTERGFRFFDAPVAVLLCVDSVLQGDGPLLDIGAVMQNICLAAVDLGLGTCIEDQGVMYPDMLREHTGISRDKRIIISIALGYPDWEFPANQLVTPRVEVDECTTWLGKG
ncbi:nitroreductase [Desulfovermiculus halophilus]|jgi:nitroreductase|uniref:nitroreductase n=1 Tax=Desulfovermiculus halophilus TaxID=339722 RepID=UPI001ABEEFB9|nr:nitroreductase [Desulfovermiculus halophilus]